MYSIIKNTDSNKTIIGNITLKTQFLEFVKKCIKNDQYTIISNIKFSDFINNYEYENGMYLLCDETIIDYVERKIVINQGYIYNTTSIDTKKLVSYELISIELENVNDSQEIIDQAIIDLINEIAYPKIIEIKKDIVSETDISELDRLILELDL
jgi:hypothetical protein